MSSAMWSVCLVTIIVACWQCEAAVWHGIGNNPDNDGCIVGSKKYAVGENWFVPGECARYECNSNRGHYSGSSCGVIGGPIGCKISGEDNTKTYPDCCPRVICPGEEGV